MLDTFRQKLLRAFQKYRAVHILLNTPSPEELRGLDDSLKNIERMPRPELSRKAKAFQKDFEQIVKRYGVRGSVNDFMHVLEEYATASEPVMYVSKYDLDRLFSKYDKRFPDIRSLPPHGRIGIEVGGRRSPVTQIQAFVLEGSLFEDMAALWNAAADATEAERADTPIPETKRAAALRRATAKAAFNLLEGYLNGLALDVELTLQVSASDQAILKEYDDARSRPVRLSLRDKILQYVKLAAQAQHPPIQESNSQSMQLVLQMENAVRHALIHPTPRLLSGDPSREAVYLNLSLDQVQAICDGVASLIREIADAVGPSFGDVRSWLFDRDSQNRYMNQTFL